jgi:hypothetical protein
MQIRRLILLIAVAATALAACSGAPAQPGANGVTLAPAATAIAPTTTTATAAAAPATGAASTAPNDATQARLRLAHFVFGGPNVDLFVNGTLVINGPLALTNLPAGYITGIVYLSPGTYHVAVVPTGKGIAQALLGPLDVPLAAGHRYTLAMIGQLKDKSVKSLLIDETAAELKIGAAPTDSVRIIVNNLAGPSGIASVWGGKIISTNIAYGGFAAERYPVGNAAIQLTVTGKPNLRLLEDDGRAEPGASYLSGIAGANAPNWDTFNAAPTSDLNVIAFLQGFSGKRFTDGGYTVSFDTLLAAIKTAGLTDWLATSGPYALFAPTDQAFAAMPKDKRDALMADPKALADLVRAHISQGYYPAYSLATTPGGSWNRTIANMLGAKMVLGEDTINGAAVGDLESTLVANGVRVSPITRVALPATK